MVGELVGDFLRRRKDKSHTRDVLEEIRKLEAYQRLKDKFASDNAGISEGLSKDSLTVGDLVDVLQLYLVCAGSSTRGTFRSISEMARLATSDNTDEVVDRELVQLSSLDATPESLNRNNPLYSVTVDLQMAVNRGSGELSHYPGGLIVSDKPGANERYDFLLTNRQATDDGKPIKQLFEETGLPVRSNIRV